MADVNVTSITYGGKEIKSLEAGKTGTVRCKGKKMKTDLVVKAGGGNTIEVSGLPIEVDSLDNSLLTAENDGKVYKCADKLYQVHKITSLKGLTIKFNEHITPCPVIGENEEFECSGVLMGDDFPYYSEGKPSVSTIKKKAIDNWISGTVFFAIATPYYDEIHYIFADNQEESGWYAFDQNGNQPPAFAPAVIYNFDCPALNENPEFMEWVFANAKVYPNIESPNEIKSFKLAQPFLSDGNTIGWYFQGAFLCGMFEANRTGVVFEIDVDGQFTATFLVNEELVTETFTNVNVYGATNSEGLPVFSNDVDNLVFLNASKTEDGIFDENGNLIPSPIKYNDIFLEDGIEFTKFDCMLNTKTKDILYFILCYTTVSGEYHNGFAFKEYDSSLKEYDGTVEVE